MPEQSTIFQCVPVDSLDSDDGNVESKIETNSTSSSLVDYNSINCDGSKSSHSNNNNKRRNRNNNDIRHFTINLAAISQQRMQAGCHSGCHSAAATVDDAFQSVDNALESAVDLFIPTKGCTPVGGSGSGNKQAVNSYQDDHTIEVDYNGTLHTIVSGSSKSGMYDEIIMVPKEKGSKQRSKRFRIIGRLFRPKKDSKKAILVDNPTTATTSQRAPTPVSPSPAPVATPTRQQGAITTVSQVDESKQQQKTTRRDANNDNNAVVVRSFGDKPQYMEPQPPKQLKSKSVNQATVAATTNRHKKQSSSSPSSSSSWWSKNSKKNSLETRRYVHEQEESIQEGDTNVLTIRMHRTPTHDMVPQTKR
jgi:hypothetical protein